MGAALWHACDPGEGVLVDSVNWGMQGESVGWGWLGSMVCVGEVADGLGRPGEWEWQTGRAKQGGRVYSPAGHQKSTLIRGCFLLRAYSKKPKSEKGKMVNTARLMTSSASI